jgi:hypothetical protein
MLHVGYVVVVVGQSGGRSSAMSGPCLPGFVQRLDEMGHVRSTDTASSAAKITTLTTNGKPNVIRFRDGGGTLQQYRSAWRATARRPPPPHTSDAASLLLYR